MFVRSRFSTWNTDIALGAAEKKEKSFSVFQVFSIGPKPAPRAFSRSSSVANCGTTNRIGPRLPRPRRWRRLRSTLTSRTRREKGATDGVRKVCKTKCGSEPVCKSELSSFLVLQTLNLVSDELSRGVLNLASAVI